MDPNKGNPFMQGGNPYMQPKPETPAAGGQMDPGMAPPGGGGGTSVTTKPRQMPGGAPPPPMGMPGDTPLGPGGAGAPPPMAMPGLEQTTDTNVPQTPQKPATAMRLKVQAIRREIMVNNPEVPTQHAQAIALAVVALQHEAASPMGPVTAPGAPQRPRQGFNDDWTDAHQQQRQRQRTMPHGDLNDPNHPYWRANGGHPFARSTVETPNVQHGHPAQDALAEPGDWVSQYGGRNPLEDHAFAQGYRGNSPHWYALTDKIMSAVGDSMPKRKTDPRHLAPGSAAPVRVHPRNNPQPPPVR